MPKRGYNYQVGNNVLQEIVPTWHMAVNHSEMDNGRISYHSFTNHMVKYVVHNCVAVAACIYEIDTNYRLKAAVQP